MIEIDNKVNQQEDKTPRENPAQNVNAPSIPVQNQRSHDPSNTDRKA